MLTRGLTCTVLSTEKRKKGLTYIVYIHTIFLININTLVARFFQEKKNENDNSVYHP